MGTPPAEGTTPTPRAGLVAAGALVVAVAVLQIAQGAISAFSPKPVIQAALVVGVGLAALAAELVRSGAAPGFVWGAAAGCVVALGTGLGIALASGFSPADPEPVGSQVARARRSLLGPKTTIVSFRRAALHEGADSFVFVTRTRSERGPSDAIRIFDASGGKLRDALTVAPRVSDGPTRLHTTFHLAGVRDLDGDGQREILGSFDTNMAGTEFQRVPVLVSFSGSRYRVTPLLRTAGLEAAARRGLPTYRFAATPGATPAPSAWVGDLAVDDGHVFLPDGVTLATTVVPQAGPSATLELPVVPKGNFAPTFVRFWRFDAADGRPKLRPLCLLVRKATTVRPPGTALGPSTFVDLPAARARLADAMERAGVHLGELASGRCLEAGS